MGGFPPFYEHETDLPGGREETRYLFGLGVRRVAADGGETWAVRPLVAHRTKPDGTEITDILPPFGRQWSRQGTRITEVWPLFTRSSFAGWDPEKGEEADDEDTWLFPLAAWGEEPEQGSYLMVLPVGGTLKGKLLADKITIYGFPLYLEVENGEHESRHVLWPLVAWGEGAGRSHLRVLPFWSQSDSDKSSHRAVLWPVVHWSEQEREGRTYDGWFVFPLVGHTASRDGKADQWTALYPFFQWSHDELTGNRYEALPFPFYKHVVKPREGVESTWWWPLWGDYTSPDEESSFYLWPLGWNQRKRLTDGATSSVRFLVPLWMRSDVVEEDGTVRRSALRSWPLFSWEDVPGDHRTVRIPDLIPVGGWDLGEMVYSDLLNLFRWTEDDQGRVAWDGPLGLVRYRRGSDGAARLRLLWWIDIPLGGGS